MSYKWAIRTFGVIAFVTVMIVIMAADVSGIEDNIAIVGWLIFSAILIK